MHSLSGKCGIGLMDTSSGQWTYLQVVNPDKLVKRSLIRGISIANNTLYSVSPASLQLYDILTDTADPMKPLFSLRREIMLPEWLIGRPEQADIIAVHASRKHEKVYVGNNALGSIDIFDLSGELIDRKHLWQIAPVIFKLNSRTTRNFQYGIIRTIQEDSDGRITLTIANCNGGGSGGVFDFKNGSMLLGDLESPHAGLVKKGRLYVLDVKKGMLKIFSFDKDNKTNDPKIEKVMSPLFPFGEETDQVQNIRGLAISNGLIHCGIFNFNRSLQKKFPSRVVSFDATTGKQIKTTFIPDFGQFPTPRIFNLLPVPEAFQFDKKFDSPVLFIKDKQVDPKRRDKSLVPRWGGPELLLKSPSNKVLQVEDADCDSTADADSVLITNTEQSVIFHNVSLSYLRLARFGFGKNKRLRKKRIFWALQDISFIFHEGETIGIIGRNGSGKSTLAQLCCKVLIPDTGNIITNGRIQLLSLGVGFRGEMTGRDNVYISGALLGLKRDQIDSCMDDIEAFAEIGDFIDEPVSTYSSGMRSRLGFAVATAIEPDILILDEIMATGDRSFRNKAVERMREMRKTAKTVIMVSHNPGQLKKLCSRILWLEKGRLIMDSTPKYVLDAYQNFCKNPDKWLERNPEIAKIIEGSIKVSEI